MLLKKSQLEVLFQSLKGTEGILTLAESRIRDAFLKKLTPELDTFYADSKVIYEKFCDKNEDGTPDTSNDQYKFKKEVKDELNKELETLVSEEVTIESPFEAKIKELVEKSNYAPKVGEAEVLDEILK